MTLPTPSTERDSPVTSNTFIPTLQKKSAPLRPEYSLMPTVLESPTKSVSFKLTGVRSLLGLGAFVSAGFVSTGFVGLRVSVGFTSCVGISVGSSVGTVAGLSCPEHTA